MKSQSYKIGICLVFMMVFLAKMIISVAPAFTYLKSKTVNAVIMQLEQESKNDKEDPEKDASKEKKFCDENYVHLHGHQVEIHSIEARVMFNQEHVHYYQIYHPTVPTPPPDTAIV